jgi:hypothetical protein
VDLRAWALNGWGYTNIHVSSLMVLVHLQWNYVEILFGINSTAWPWLIQYVNTLLKKKRKFGRDRSTVT